MKQCKREKACELLVPVYGWFPEGFGATDHEDARQVLDELAAPNSRFGRLEHDATSLNLGADQGADRPHRHGRAWPTAVRLKFLIGTGSFSTSWRAQARRRPAIHVFICHAKDVDAAAKPRHDDLQWSTAFEAEPDSSGRGPAIHVFIARKEERRGCRGQAAA